jgi:hypothetical protein
MGAPVGPQLASGRFHDLRSSASQNNLGGRHNWQQITGVTLHQTACILNGRTVGVEMNGTYTGVEGDDRSGGPRPNPTARRKRRRPSSSSQQR